MLLRELFDKEFLYESKKTEKMNKIFYKFDIKIIKKEEEEEDNQNDQQAQDQNPQPEQPQMEPQPEVDLSAPQPEIDPGAVAAQPEQPAQPETTSSSFIGLGNVPTATVVTEDDDNKIEINDDNNIVRKLEGEIVVPKEDVDNIQTLEDLISKLTEEKIEGVNILDEFTADVIQVLANPNSQQQVSTMIDKKSMIFSEILYGKKKEDSVGIRIIKRKNSDMVTTTMLIDNQIINAPYKKDTLDERIVAIRNNEYSDDGDN